MGTLWAKFKLVGTVILDTDLVPNTRVDYHFQVRVKLCGCILSEI